MTIVAAASYVVVTNPDPLRRQDAFHLVQLALRYACGGYGGFVVAHYLSQIPLSHLI
ncbi:hypothetical protein [Kribbella sp. C-35]|uniref:hypothetical protein n=1 Tax=Kribbella sp. C-35 TaxID=2789276 RepID=UPI00397AA3CB